MPDVLEKTVTFVMTVPKNEGDITLINILVRQAQNSIKDKDNVLRACKYIVNKYEEK